MQFQLAGGVVFNVPSALAAFRGKAFGDRRNLASLLFHQGGALRNFDMHFIGGRHMVATLSARLSHFFNFLAFFFGFQETREIWFLFLEEWGGAFLFSREITARNKQTPAERREFVVFSIQTNRE